MGIRLMFGAMFWIAILNPSAQAGSLHSCTVGMVQGLDASKKPEKHYCIADMPEGAVGDSIEIRKPSGLVIARGKIIKRLGRFAQIFLAKIEGDIEAGYLVMLRNTDSNDHWTATTSSF